MTIRLRSGMPIQLFVYATRQLNNCLSADRIIEGSDQHVCAGRFRLTNRFVYTRH